MTTKYYLTESSSSIGSSLAAPRVSCVSFCRQETTIEHTVLFQAWKKDTETCYMHDNVCSYKVTMKMIQEVRGHLLENRKIVEKGREMENGDLE
jgi:hypothetical protein